MDVRERANQTSVGITEDRLISSDADEVVRYVECRQLAEDVIAASGVGIGYPSAAAAWRTWNLVLFGEPATHSWTATAHREVARPQLVDADIRMLPAR